MDLVEKTKPISQRPDKRNIGRHKGLHEYTGSPNCEKTNPIKANKPAVAWKL